MADFATAMRGVSGQPGSQVPNYTPAQQAQFRESDITKGQQRGREIFVNDPVMRELRARREAQSQGLNSNEYQAMRDDMIKGLQRSNSGYMRALMSSQGAGGVGGARASAQRAELANQFSENRANAERKLLLDNIALKRQGLDAYQDLALRQQFGQYASGLGEAQLGVGDRTGYLQGIVGQQMAQAAAQQPPPSLFDRVFGGIL